MRTKPDANPTTNWFTQEIEARDVAFVASLLQWPHARASTISA
jgi:hypothetical protein